MVEKVLLGGFIFLIGIVAGVAIKVIIENIVERAFDHPSVPTKSKEPSKKTDWLRLIPVVIGVISFLIWLQPAYQIAPFYIFTGNVSLIWLLTLVALIDYFTHLIYPRTLLAAIGLVGVVLVAVTFFDVSIGVAFDKTLGVLQAVNTKTMRKPDFINLVQLWPLNILDSLAGAIIAGSLFGLFYILGRLLFKQEVYGSGDVWLAAFIGAGLGFQRSIISIGLTVAISLAAGVILIILRRKLSGRDYYIAYGPFLCAGAILCLMFGLSLNF